jgi:hypothetical protein
MKNIMMIIHGMQEKINMKTFDQLTDIQKEQALEFALQTLEEGLNDGILTLSRNASEQELFDLALIAAEESQYDDSGRVVMGFDKKPWFQGGCV